MQEDVIVVDLDGGTLTVPESVTLYSFSQEILHPLRVALKRVWYAVSGAVFLRSVSNGY